ncbi:HB2J protein, partial [Cnemophilus loriae]|nr:HB2J protein [Cnemophilus loriae]
DCHFINGTEKVRLVERHSYNRQQFVMFDSEVGRYVGFDRYGEEQARYWNSNPVIVEQRRAEVDTVCRHNYEVITPFSVERRGPPSAATVLPTPSQP